MKKCNGTKTMINKCTNNATNMATMIRKKIEINGKNTLKTKPNEEAIEKTKKQKAMRKQCLNQSKIIKQWTCNEI